MPRRWKEIVRLGFYGPRFEGHAIEIPALIELLHFQELVKSVAKASYFKRHPQAGRLPSRFEEMLTLRFSRIDEGSAVIPLEAPEDYDETMLNFAQSRSPAEEAANLVYKTVDAAGDHRA